MTDETPGAQAQAAKAAARKRTPRTRAKAAAPQPEPDTSPCPGCVKVGEEHKADCTVLMEDAFNKAFKDMGTIGPVMEAPYVEYMSVHELWARVMESVRSVAKGDFNEDQGFRFRGIDAVVDAVGPALRAYGVHVRPRRILGQWPEVYTSKRGSRMVNRVVHVEWEVTGPLGDSFLGESMGEAADMGDKSLTKAQSVAYRVYLLQALAIPTGEPDPDASAHERANEGDPYVQQGFVRQDGAQPQQQATYASRDEARQAQAGEENQAAQADLETARKEMWRVAKGLGWEWPNLVSRFKSDNDGREPMQTNAKVIEQFTAQLITEAQAEEDRAKEVASNVLGATEVPPDEAQSGSIL